MSGSLALVTIIGMRVVSAAAKTMSLCCAPSRPLSLTVAFCAGRRNGMPLTEKCSGPASPEGGAVLEELLPSLPGC
ncbi:hypothetical protein [Teichococcus vastitatis]|uniref:hypothetical protein n=1 Tax=Teichococcus vastitatis TaxID=2307076 RepID=UPI00138FE2A5|nr:hypothetical protein [Pseudoroseomonas vastitatis]